MRVHFRAICFHSDSQVGPPVVVLSTDKNRRRFEVQERYQHTV